MDSALQQVAVAPDLCDKRRLLDFLFFPPALSAKWSPMQWSWAQAVKPFLPAPVEACSGCCKHKGKAWTGGLRVFDGSFRS